jgi:dnd system-associated protein 4
MVRRIKRPKEQEGIYKELTNTQEFGFFETYKDVFMLAGTVGFMEKKRTEFSASAEGIPWNVFNLETDEPIINAIALAETENYEILRNDPETFDKRLNIFEEYAAGGIPIIHKKIMESPKNALNNYFEYIKSMEVEENDKKRNLKDIVNTLF